MFVVLKGIVTNVGDLAQNNYMRQLSFYDKAIAKREKELREFNSVIKKEQIRLVKGSLKRDSGLNSNNSQIPKSVTIYSGDFLDSDFPQKYQIIRSFFGQGHQQYIKKLIEREKAGQTDTYAFFIKQFLEHFSLNERYNLSTLEEQDQLTFLEEVLNTEEFRLVKNFKELHATFDCLKFFDWLEEEAFRFDSSIIVRTARQNESFDKLDKRIRIHYDSNICEGLQIIMGNKLYDFAICKREIGG